MTLWRSRWPWRAPELEVVGLASVGGNVGLDQATRNIGRLLAALGIKRWPKIARGLDQPSSLLDAKDVHGDDGLGKVDLPTPERLEPGGYVELYEELIDKHGEGLGIVAIGPLTNLAALLRGRPGLLDRVGRVVIMGGAIWCKGNITPHAEFNFYRDPQAAMDVLGSGVAGDRRLARCDQPGWRWTSRISPTSRVAAVERANCWPG